MRSCLSENSNFMPPPTFFLTQDTAAIRLNSTLLYEVILRHTLYLLITDSPSFILLYIGCAVSCYTRVSVPASSLFNSQLSRIPSLCVL